MSPQAQLCHPLLGSRWTMLMKRTASSRQSDLYWLIDSYQQDAEKVSSPKFNTLFLSIIHFASHLPNCHSSSKKYILKNGIVAQQKSNIGFLHQPSSNRLDAPAQEILSLVGDAGRNGHGSSVQLRLSCQSVKIHQTRSQTSYIARFHLKGALNFAPLIEHTFHLAFCSSNLLFPEFSNSTDTAHSAGVNQRFFD